MKNLLAIGLLCFAATCFGQVKSTVETRYSLSGIEGYQIVADQILVPQSSKPSLVPIGLLSVDSKASMIRVTATTKDRVPVQVKKVSPNTFFVYGSGSIYTDVLCVDFDLKIFEQEQFVITIGDTVPIPQPDPQPQPDDKVPIKEPGLRIMIVYESRDVNRPSVQGTIMFSTTLREYARTHCVTVNRNPEFRLFDKDVSLTGESKIWQDAMARPRQSLPWLLISNGKAGYEGPLPATLDATMALVKKYGGE